MCLSRAAFVALVGCSFDGEMWHQAVLRSSLQVPAGFAAAQDSHPGAAGVVATSSVCEGSFVRIVGTTGDGVAKAALFDEFEPMEFVVAAEETRS